MNHSFQLSFLLCLIIFPLLHQRVNAEEFLLQQFPSTADSSTPHSLLSVHKIGYGASIASGDATLGRESLLLSFSYITNFLSSSANLEASLHYSSIAGKEASIAGYNLQFLSVAWTGDLCWWTYPLLSAQQFGIAIGSALRWHNQINTVLVLGNGGSQIDVDYLQALSLGVVLKMSYDILRFHNVNISVRGQLYLFAEPFFADGFSPYRSSLGGASAGVFFLLYSLKFHP